MTTTLRPLLEPLKDIRHNARLDEAIARPLRGMDQSTPRRE